MDGLASALALILALALPLGFADPQRDVERFTAVARARPADRRGALGVEADRHAHIMLVGAGVVGRVERDPAEVGHIRFRPGVSCILKRAVGAREIAADIARRYAEPARAGDEDMRKIL